MRRARARQAQAFALGIGASVLALFAVGCPGPADLANPQDYPTAAGTSTGTAGTATAGTASGGTASGGTASGGDACETECIKSLFQKEICASCHNNAGVKFAGLDLKGDGVTARLKNVPATFTDLTTGTAADCPSGAKLIDTTTPANSWLLKKVRGDQDQCGTEMPAGGATDPQKACVEAYVACVAPGGAAPSGGTSSGGTTSGGSGGTGGT